MLEKLCARVLRTSVMEVILRNASGLFLLIDVVVPVDDSVESI